jgi:hypothetical protein
MSRADDLIRFYALLDRLEHSIGGRTSIAEMLPSRFWPSRGVYFFFEPGERRSNTGHGLRLVRIGTHALVAGSRSTLHQRLKQHAGAASGAGGNHRGSIFRLLIGEALIARGDHSACPSWGVGTDPSKAAASLAVPRNTLIAAERSLEAAVSAHLATMQCLWLPIDDEPGPASLRGYIERNCIALMSGFHGPPTDPASPRWLGMHSSRAKVRQSGLWNQRHVNDEYDPACLVIFETALERAFSNPPPLSRHAQGGSAQHNPPPSNPDSQSGCSLHTNDQNPATSAGTDL